MLPHSDTDELSFREATRTDLEALLLLMQAYYQADHLDVSPRHTWGALEQFFSSQDQGRIWMLDYQGEQAGYLALTWSYSFEYGGRVAEVDELYVAPHFRGRGFGQAALSFAETTCRALEMKALSLEALPDNEGARRLYRRFGFNKVMRDFFLKHL